MASHHHVLKVDLSSPSQIDPSVVFTNIQYSDWRRQCSPGDGNFPSLSPLTLSECLARRGLEFMDARQCWVPENGEASTHDVSIWGWRGRQASSYSKSILNNYLCLLVCQVCDLTNQLLEVGSFKIGKNSFYIPMIMLNDELKVIIFLRDSQNILSLLAFSHFSNRSEFIIKNHDCKHHL